MDSSDIKGVRKARFFRLQSYPFVQSVLKFIIIIIISNMSDRRTIAEVQREMYMIMRCGSDRKIKAFFGSSFQAVCHLWAVKIVPRLGEFPGFTLRKLLWGLYYLKRYPLMDEGAGVCVTDVPVFSAGVWEAMAVVCAVLPDVCYPF